jgi:hypothetical protein
MAADDTLEIAYNEAELQPADLLLMLQDLEPKVIIYEDFQYRNRARNKLVLFSVQLIGIVDAYATLAPNCYVKKQQPAEGMGHYSDDALRRLDLYQKGTVHGRDAARHMLHFCTFKAGWMMFADKNPKFRMVPYASFGA